MLRVDHDIGAGIDDGLNPEVNFCFFCFEEIVFVSSLEPMVSIENV